MAVRRQRRVGLTTGGVAEVGRSVGRVAVRCQRRVGLTTGGVAEVGRSQLAVRLWVVKDVKVERSGGTLQACRCGGICLKRSGAREACCGPGDVEVFASRDLELGRHAAGLETLPQKRSRGMLRAWERGGMEIWSSGGVPQAWGRGRCRSSRVREACCGPGNAEVFASRDLKLGKHAVGLGTWRHVEVFVSGGALL